MVNGNIKLKTKGMRSWITIKGDVDARSEEITAVFLSNQWDKRKNIPIIDINPKNIDRNAPERGLKFPIFKTIAKSQVKTAPCLKTGTLEGIPTKGKFLPKIRSLADR